MKAPLHVHWLRSLDEVTALGDVYTHFLKTQGDRALFYELERLHAVWPLYARLHGEFAWLWVERAGAMVGLAPLQRQAKPLHKGGVRVLHAFGAVRGAVSQWYKDWLCAEPELAEPVVAAVRDALLGEFSSRWDLLELELLCDDAPCTAALRRLLPGCTVKEHSAVTSRIELPDGFEAFRGQLDGKFLREIGREERKAEQLWGAVKFCSEPTLTTTQWQAMETLHTVRQRELRGEGIERVALFDDPYRAAAFRVWLTTLYRADRMQHYWLELGGHLAAFMTGARYGETFFLLLTAMAEEFAKVSPTRLLLWRLVQAEAARGTRVIDFGVGDNLFKRQFRTHAVATCDLGWSNTATAARLRVGWLGFLRRLKNRPSAAPAKPSGD